MSASNWRASASVWAESARRPLNFAKPGIFAIHSAKAVSHSASDLKSVVRSQVSWGLTLERGGRDWAALPLLLDVTRGRGLVALLAFVTGRRAGDFLAGFREVEVLAI